MQGLSGSDTIELDEVRKIAESPPADKKSEKRTNRRTKCKIIASCEDMSINKSSLKRKRKFAVISLSLVLLVGLAVLTRYRNILPTTIRPFDLNDRTLSHQQREYTINSALNVTLCVVVLIFCIVMWCIFEGNILKDRKNGAISKQKLLSMFYMIYFIVLGGCLLILLVYSIKCLAGQLRPYFIDACKLDQDMVDQLLSQGKTWVDENLAEVICTNKETLRYRWSFPSGHSAEVG